MMRWTGSGSGRRAVIRARRADLTRPVGQLSPLRHVRRQCARAAWNIPYEPLEQIVRAVSGGCVDIVRNEHETDTPVRHPGPLEWRRDIAACLAVGRGD